MAVQSAGEAMRGERVVVDDVYAAEIRRLVALGTILAGDGAAGEDLAGNVMTSTDPTGGAGAWTLTNISADITGLPNFDSVSCASTTLCVIGSLSDHVYMSTDPTGGSAAWIPVRVIPQGEAAMFGLSCPTNAFCVGVDGSAGVHVYTNPNG